MKKSSVPSPRRFVFLFCCCAVVLPTFIAFVFEISFEAPALSSCVGGWVHFGASLMMCLVLFHCVAILVFALPFCHSDRLLGVACRCLFTSCPFAVGGVPANPFALHLHLREAV